VWQALFKKSAAAPKAPTKAAKKAAVKPSGTKTTRGWLGGAGGAQGLDKWYGEWLAADSCKYKQGVSPKGSERTSSSVPSLASIPLIHTS
jgi:hypothetical protein